MPSSMKTILCLSLLTNCLCAMQQVKQVTRLDAEGATPYVGEALRALRAEVGPALPSVYPRHQCCNFTVPCQHT